MARKSEYPSGEIVWVEYYSGAGVLLYGVTSKPARDMYYLYEHTGNGCVKVGKDKDAGALVKRFGVLEKMRGAC